MRKLFGKVLLLLIIVLPFPLEASQIDFRVNPWVDPMATSISNTINGLQVTVESSPGYLWWDSTDGYGIKGGEDDEVDLTERLHIAFDQTVELKTILITDLFWEDPDPGYKEYGFYSTDNSNWIGFIQNVAHPGANANGELYITGLSLQTTDLYFAAEVPGGDTWFLNEPTAYPQEFSVALLDVQVVPIPGAVWLLGSGLVGLVGLRRRFNKGYTNK